MTRIYRVLEESKNGCNVKVKFTDGKSYIYNCFYKVELGDIVHVAGKKERTQGVVIEVKNKLKYGNYMQLVTSIYRELSTSFNYIEHDK